MCAKTSNDKYCLECGDVIDRSAFVCPRCGARQPDLGEPAAAVATVPPADNDHEDDLTPYEVAMGPRVTGSASPRSGRQILVILACLLGGVMLIDRIQAQLPPAPAMSVVEAERLRMQGGESDKTCDSSQKQRDAAAQMITLAGYDCKVADAVCPYLFSEGFTVYCNHRYSFEVENHGGRWSVKAN